MNRIAGTIFTTVVSFTAGLVTGLLIAPKSGKENREWISEHGEEAKQWVELKGQRLIEESEKRIGKISENIKEAIPDLYSATEEMHFNDEELEDA
ncbi:MAG TPA: YtxH domain-containing protein [Balneolaceae bacterium]|nr:YtxH domain-containing protein [Balneolaceae bacterium]|tara:strand:- start:87474 stop:87758 length:285 start_codon:yes stop_codon:yes gene_type:complete